jgi:thioredoxin reductase
VTFPLEADTDVIVCGAGPAGLTAAITAARAGAKVRLKMKSRRQMIFVTHNPNIPVLGDAERVFVLDSDGAMARKANEGTVDECKREIVNLLEGGENAFKVRKCRYAY